MTLRVSQRLLDGAERGKGRGTSVAPSPDEGVHLGRREPGGRLRAALRRLCQELTPREAPCVTWAGGSPAGLPRSLQGLFQLLSLLRRSDCRWHRSGGQGEAAECPLETPETSSSETERRRARGLGARFPTCDVFVPPVPAAPQLRMAGWTLLLCCTVLGAKNCLGQARMG